MNRESNGVLESLSKLADELPFEEIPALQGLLANISIKLGLRSMQEMNCKPDLPEHFISIEQAAEIGNLSVRWLKTHYRKLPFIQRKSRKQWAVAEMAFRRWMSIRKA